ncbi:MAG: hypothetical protein IIC18_00445 [Bacteroidetes bacterium]|nr:hypothetical protein [Bacteroidota bacterium]MCH8030219.1 hypothetical protein [Bacteroidota bacterium]
MVTKLPPDFSEFLKSLAEYRVEYLLIGGYAVGYHGYARFTGDIDVWVRPTEENAERIIGALREFGFDVPSLRTSLFTKPGRITRMGIPPNQIEVFSSVPGVAFDECWPDRVEDEWDGVPVTVIGLDCLKTNKRASGRLKDLADLDELP